MSTWHKQVSKSLADSVSAVLQDMAADNKTSQNKMLKKGKGEPAGQVKPKQELPEDDLDPVNPTAVKKKFANRKDKDIDNDGDTDSSDKFLHKKRKAISKAVRKTSAESKKIKLSKKKEKVEVNPSIKEQRQNLRVGIDESGMFTKGKGSIDPKGGYRKPKPTSVQKSRTLPTGGPGSRSSVFKKAVKKYGANDKDIKALEALYKKRDNLLKKKGNTDRIDKHIGSVEVHFADSINEETLEASFDTVFQYSNEAEESFREQWMGEFDSHVSSKDPHAYIDPLQRKVLYIEGLTAQAAANRYLSHCIANVALSGGQYQKYGTRGGDPVASAQHQGTGLTGGVPANYQGKV